MSEWPLPRYSFGEMLQAARLVNDSLCDSVAHYLSPGEFRMFQHFILHGTLMDPAEVRAYRNL